MTDNLSGWEKASRYADGTILTEKKCAYTYNQLYKKVGPDYYKRIITKRIQMSWFPNFFQSENTNGHDVSHIVQRVINVASLMKKDVELPEGVFLYKYPVFVKSNVYVWHQGLSTRIIANISASEGRCCYCIGSSREWNENMVEQLRSEKRFGLLENHSFSDVPAKTGFKLQANSQYVRVRHAGVCNVFIDFDYSGKGRQWGGYGVQINNAYDCHIRDLWSRNATQSWGIGSDVGFNTPGSIGCTVTRNHVISPCRYWTYYACGFMANSNNCHARDLTSDVEVSNNSNDGSVFAFNFCENCSVKNLQAKVGRSKTSEGILINNSRSCVVDGFVISNAKRAVATFYNTEPDGSNFLNINMPNIIKNGAASLCDYNISIFSKYDRFENIKGQALIAQLQFGNVNATNNIITKSIEKDSIKGPANTAKDWPFTYNTFNKD